MAFGTWNENFFSPAYFSWNMRMGYNILWLCLLCTAPYTTLAFPSVDDDRLADRQLVQSIYRQLQAVIGDKRVDWPAIDIWQVKDQMATYAANDNQIYIDQAAVDICRTLNGQFEAALAFIIGHELTHFYQSHKWKNSGFTSRYLMNTADFEQHQDHERQADIYGGFIAYQAGYNILSLVPTLLDALYQGYRIDPDRDLEYPSLAKRKDLTNNALAMAGDLINMYRAANYLAAIGAYDEAFQLYEHVSKNVQFKEVFNNMGVCSLFHLFKMKAPTFLYPLEMSTRIPLTRTDTYRSEWQLLQDAQRYLGLATDYDPGYTDALLNLLVAHDRAGNELAVENAKSRLLLLRLTPLQEAKLNIIYGNFHAAKNQEEQAEERYEAVIRMRSNQSLSRMAKTNLRALKKGKPVVMETPTMPIQKTNPITQGINLFSFNRFDVDIELRPGTVFSIAELPNAALSAIRFNKKVFRFHWITAAEIQVQGVGIGSTLEGILQNLDEKALQFVGFQEGQFVIDQAAGLIFKINLKGEVEEWAKFAL